MKIAFIVSGNGYGHLKRVCAVIKEIFKIEPGTEVVVLGAANHEPMLKVWNYKEYFQQHAFTFINTGLEAGLSVNLPTEYTFDKYINSLEETVRVLTSQNPSVIVSDNVTGILKDFPKALLMGSFLWSDTLRARYPNHTEIEKICLFEEALLMNAYPVMIGLEDMVMPYVRTYTRFIGLPWFCEGRVNSHKTTTGKKNVLLTGGGTLRSFTKLLTLARALRQSDLFTVNLDNSLYHGLQDDEREVFIQFDFSEQSFELLDWIICRPGIGILTEAVQYYVPVCTLNEDDAEMNFNSQRIEAMRIGIRLPDQIMEALNKLNETDPCKFYPHLNERATGGAVMAARYILKL